MERTELLERINKLEQEIHDLREMLDPPKRQTRVARGVSTLLKFVASYWALLSFMLAILTVVYVQVEFGVDYFESYRNIATNKKLSAFYQELGDRMMVYGEWKAARDAYGKALDINANDTQAAYGAVKASVFDPLEGDHFWAPEVVNAKLDYLLENFPQDYQVYFLKGTAVMAQGDMQGARQWFQRSVELNPQFVGGYVDLGYVSQAVFDMPGAITNYQKALDLDPGSSMATNNLGFIYILQTKFLSATAYLERSYSASPHLLTAINLGDAYRYADQLDRALAWHRLALSGINDPTVVGEQRYMGGQWLFNYMPLAPGDTETTRSYVYMSSTDQKKMAVHYALSFDYALLGNVDQADSEFEAARELDPDGVYSSFIANKIESMQKFIPLKDANVQNWLKQHRASLLTQ